MQVQVNRWQRIVQRMAAFRPVALTAASILPSIDRIVLRLSHNRYTATSLLAGLPIIALTTTGAKSGQPRTVPLVALEDRERLVLIASNFGRGHHPAWYYNLRADPRATVHLRNQTTRYHAREATAQEHEHYWQAAVSLYPGYAAYKEQATNRQIPVFVLEPHRDPQ